jgi:hypothetical protein
METLLAPFSSSCFGLSHSSLHLSITVSSTYKFELFFKAKSEFWSSLTHVEESLLFLFGAERGVIDPSSESRSEKYGVSLSDFESRLTWVILGPID